MSNPKLIFRVDNIDNKTSTVILSLTQKKDNLKIQTKAMNCEYKYCIRMDLYQVWQRFFFSCYIDKNLNYSIHIINEFKVARGL